MNILWSLASVAKYEQNQPSFQKHILLVNNKFQ